MDKKGRCHGSNCKRTLALLENYDSERLKSAFWAWFAAFFEGTTTELEYCRLLEEDCPEYNTTAGVLWRRFLNEHHLRISMNTLRPVGASGGQLTSFICYDVHLGSKIVHCYPVTGIEAVDIMGEGELVINDGLNC
jgi:hypothetical protein